MKYDLSFAEAVELKARFGFITEHYLEGIELLPIPDISINNFDANQVQDRWFYEITGRIPITNKLRYYREMYTRFGMLPDKLPRKIKKRVKNHELDKSKR